MPKVWILLLLLLPVQATAAVYRWVDSHGEIVYAAKPHPGAKKIETAPPPAFSAEVRRASPSPPAVVVREYRGLHLVSPSPGETVHSNTGDVAVALALTPPLRANAGHVFKVYLDGRLQAGEWTTAAFTLGHVARGAHTLRAVVMTKDRTVLISSGATAFFLWRASRLFPSRRALPPPP